MDADLVYDLCKAMNEHTEELAAGNALLKDMTDPSFLCTQMPIPLHAAPRSTTASRASSNRGILKT